MFRSERDRGRRTHTFRVLAPMIALVVAACESPLDPAIDLVLSQGVLEFHAIRGSAAPLTRTITVSNGGGGRLGPVSCPEQPADWLSCTVSSGSELRLTANPSGFTTSPARVNVPITAPGVTSPRSLAVDLIIEQPVLALSASQVPFFATETGTTTSPATATLTVTNSGAGTLASLGTLTCAPTPVNQRVGCVVDHAAGTLVVSVDPAGLAPGTHVFALSVGAEHSAVSHSVSLTLQISALPRLELSRTSLHFEAIRGSTSQLSQTIEVTNRGEGSLGTVSCPANPASWLACSVSGSTLTFTASPATLTASPAPIAVNVGATAAINSPQAVSVSFTIEQPILALSANAVAFTAQLGGDSTTPAQHVVAISNTGAGTLANLGAITCTPPQDSPVTCTVDQTTGELSLSADPAEVGAGESSYIVQVAAAHSGVTRAVTVRLTVAAPPSLVLTPSLLHFEAIRGSTAPLSQTAAISNAGGGSLGTVACPAIPASWLTCVVDGGEALFVANPTGLLVDPLPVLVPFTAAGAPGDTTVVTVRFTIRQPVLALSASTAVFQATAPATQTDPESVVIQVTNTGAGTLENLGTITCDAPAPAECAVTQATGTLTLTVDPDGLAEGVYVFIVQVSAAHMSNSSPQPVAIILTLE